MNRIRKTFIMKLHPDCAEEYKKRHDELWPEMLTMLKEHGVHNYSISLCEQSHQLFAYAEIESEAKWQAIASTAICQKWWQYMGDIMPSNEDGSPLSSSLKEVFYME